MTKKIKIITIATLVIIVIGIITFKLVSDYNKENKIKNEVKEIMNYYKNNSYNDPELSKILDRQLIEKGPYSQVEYSIKQYYKDLTEDLSNLDFLLSEDNFSNYLSEQNIKEDKPMFIKSKDNLDNTRKQIESVYQEIDNQLNDDTYIISYIYDKEVKPYIELKTYYKEFYLSLIKENITEEYKNSLKNKKNTVINNIEIYQDAFNYLISTKEQWDIESNSIIFNNQPEQDEYNKIIEKIKEVSKN